MISLTLSLVANAAAFRLHVGMVNNEWYNWFFRSTAVSASWQRGGIGSSIDCLPMALQLSKSLTCIIRAGCDFQKHDKQREMNI